MWLLLYGLDKFIHVKQLEQCLEYSKYLINGTNMCMLKIFQVIPIHHP